MIHWGGLTIDGRIDAIRSVWFPGCSALQIAKNFEGVSRNAIIGMYNRHGKRCLLDKPLRSHAAANADAKHKNRRSKATALFPFQLVTKTSKPMAPPVETEFEHRLVGKPLMMLGAKECKFSINEAARDEIHLFCSMPTEGRSYCHHHESRSHQPPRDR